MSYSPNVEMASNFKGKIWQVGYCFFGGCNPSQTSQSDFKGHLSQPLIQKITQGSGARIGAGIRGPGQQRVCWAHSDCGPEGSPPTSWLVTQVWPLSPAGEPPDCSDDSSFSPLSHSLCDQPHSPSLYPCEGHLAGCQDISGAAPAGYPLCWAWFWIYIHNGGHKPLD